jgi:hypothetical protein
MAKCLLQFDVEQSLLDGKTEAEIKQFCADGIAPVLSLCLLQSQSLATPAPKDGSVSGSCTTNGSNTSCTGTVTWHF